VLAILLALTACNRGNRDTNAIRQGVLDHLAGRSLNVANMDIDIPSVQYQGDKADVTVVFKPKGVSAQGMTLHYQMQQSGGRWTVVNTQDSGHSTSVPQGTPNPHGGGELPVTGNPHGAMPAPSDLPPVEKK